MSRSSMRLDSSATFVMLTLPAPASAVISVISSLMLLACSHPPAALDRVGRDLVPDPAQFLMRRVIRGPYIVPIRE